MLASLAKVCIQKGFRVRALAMPHADKPTINDWVGHLAKNVGTVDGETFFVGHSIGCQTILRYLSSQKEKCGGAIFIGGWVELTGLETEEEEAIARPWIETEINDEAAKKAIAKSIAIFSDNDPFVPISNAEKFKRRFGSEIVVEKGKGHFTEQDSIKELPSAQISLFRIAGKK